MSDRPLVVPFAPDGLPVDVARLRQVCAAAVRMAG